MGKTEADFEAAIRGVIEAIFPGLNPSEIRHQQSFSIRLGHKDYNIEGTAAAWASGRSDISLHKDGKPLAVLELKKNDIHLASGDEKQALSYARLMEPWPPIVVLSNGKITKLYETFTGKEWKPESLNEQALQDLIARGAAIATADKRNAMDTLLGPGPGIWKSVVKDITTDTLEDLTGEISDFMAPFAADLLFPRRVTHELIGLIKSSTGVPILTGAPLAGKSSVLRELAVTDDNELSVLFIDMASSQHGIFQSIANSLTQRLGWDVSVDVARSWMLRLSKEKMGPKLVLALDGGPVSFIKTELDELTSQVYGPNLRVVIAVDRASFSYLTLASGGRQNTRLGRRAKKLEVGPLDDQEFEYAISELHRFRMAIAQGGQKTPKLRTPWILRSIAAEVMQDPHYQDDKRVAVIPSVPGIRMIYTARERFDENTILRGRCVQIAEAVLEDALAGDRSGSFALESTLAYLCKRTTAERIAGAHVVRELIDGGYLHETLLPGQELVLKTQIPDFFASCLSTALANRIAENVDNEAETETTAQHVIKVAGAIPFGEAIAALAIIEAGIARSGIPMQFLQSFIDEEPREEDVPPGAKVAMILSSGVHLRMDYQANGRLVGTLPDGRTFEIGSESDEPPFKAKVNFMPWLVLSHLVSQPLAVVDGEGSQQGWLDSAIMSRVASSSVTLLGPSDMMLKGIYSHHLPDGSEIVCHQEGIVEPITHSMLEAMAMDNDRAEFIVSEALESKSLAFLARVDIALRRLMEGFDDVKANWARDTLQHRIQPALAGTPLSH